MAAGFEIGGAAGRGLAAVAADSVAGLAGAALAIFGGTGVVAMGGAAAADGLVASPLRKSPRATRRVPFACSTLMGFVSTRLAPMRNALATPGCPSTTATARDA